MWSRGTLGIEEKSIAPRAIDPAANTAEMSNFDVDLSGVSKYACCYTMSDGLIYFPPYTAKTMLVLDNSAHRAVRVPIPGIDDLTSGAFWIGGIVGPDRKLRCPPSGTDKFLNIG